MGDESGMRGKGLLRAQEKTTPLGVGWEEDPVRRGPRGRGKILERVQSEEDG